MIVYAYDKVSKIAIIVTFIFLLNCIVTNIQRIIQILTMSIKVQAPKHFKSLLIFVKNMNFFCSLPIRNI